MRYLPILQELFESDSIIFMIIGVVIAVFVGLRLKNPKKNIKAIIISVNTYVICELASNIRTDFLIELILLFIGTVAIGCCLGFIICMIINFMGRGIRSQKGGLE